MRNHFFSKSQGSFTNSKRKGNMENHSQLCPGRTWHYERKRKKISTRLEPEH